jgi:uncharacterized protein YeaC (DUF1315 family)
MNFEEIMRMMTPEVYANMKRAVELGKWPNGQRLSAEQRQNCLQAMIAWEERSGVPEDQRTGYLERKGCSSGWERNDEAVPSQVMDLKSEPKA